MRPLTLVLSWIALAGAAASGVMFVLIGDSKEKLVRELAAAETRSAELATSLHETEAARADLQGRLEALDNQFAATKRELTATRLRLEEGQRALELAESRHAETQAESERTQAALAQARIDLAHAEDRLAQALPSAEAVRYRQTIALLENRVIELESVAQNAPRPLVASRGDHAQVVGVGPQNAFVVINFGQKHGARPNQRLRISRGTDPLAMVEISDTRENYSVAQVLPASLSGKLRKGDAATLTPSNP